MRIVFQPGGLVTTVLMAVAVVTPAEAATAPTPTREVASPLGLTTNAADYLDAPAKAMVLRVDQSVVESLWGVESVLMRDVVLPTGPSVDLDLVRVNNPIESTWLIAADAFGQAEKIFVPAADVILLTGSVVGQPDRRAFIGLSNGQAQGWIETDDGMHVISTPAGGGPTLMYLVGSERGGIDIPPPPPAESGLVKATPESGLVAQWSPSSFEPRTDADRILVAVADPDSPMHGSMSAERILKLLDFPVGAAERGLAEIDLEFGACCLVPGLCVQATIEECRVYCPSVDMDGFCGNPYDPNDDSIPPPCWLGPGVPCDELWVCYEAAVQGPDDPDDAPWIDNWTGACCFPDPDNIGQKLFEDKMACECAMLGGDFVAVPAFCLGEYLPAEAPAENFVGVEAIEDLLGPGVDFCSLPAGACCVEQNVLCASLLEGEDEVIQQFFERIGCLYIPQVLCEDAAIITGTFSGTGGPGLFIKECFPCSYDVIGPNDAFLCAVEVPDNTVAPLLPKGVRCQTPRIVIDTDTWYLERFNGDIGAAQAYATLLMAATTFIFERDALVSLQIGELLLRGVPVIDPITGDPFPLTNPYLPGACCAFGSCFENTSYGDCTGSFLQGEWQGPGSSCWEGSTDCENDPIDPGDPRPWTINGTLSNMDAEWGLNGSAAALEIDYDMVLLLSGFPYEEPYEGQSEWGVIPQGVAAGGGTMCNSALNPFAVAAVQGSFPYPGSSFDAYDVNWDPVMVSQAVAISIGVSVTRAYGYDRCLGLPCEYGADATADCDFQRALPGYAGGQMPPTIMSNCYLCEGGTSNFQMRFRSEIAARLFARLANLDCVAAGSTTAGPYEVEIDDPNNPGQTITVMVPIAANDTIRVFGTQPQPLDVLVNDVAIGCTADADGDLVLTQLNGVNAPVVIVTPQGGVCSIDTDPVSGEQVVLYVPPPTGLCGIDYFEYTIESPDPANPGTSGTSTATVKLLRQPVAGDVTIEPVPWIDCMPGACCVASGVCVDMAEVTCLIDGGSWQGAGTACGDAGIPCPPGTVNACLDLVAQATWPQSITEPPFAATPPTLPVDQCRLDMLQVDVINPADLVYAITWDGLVAQIVDDSVTQPQELLMRFWFATSPGGLPSEFVDVRPFADPAITTACGPLVAPPVVGNIVGPSFGQCQLGIPRYVPSQNGVTAIPVQLLVDHDEVPGADACWIEGSVTIYAGDDGGYGEVQSIGACCIGGLCIETNPYDCLALSGFDLSIPNPPDGTDPIWIRSAISSGFFMGVGTTCDEADWCRPTAPCCYDNGNGERACEQLTGDDCWLVGRAFGNDPGDYGSDWGTIGAIGNAFVDATSLDGVAWAGPLDEPAWGLGCDYPVCFTDSYLSTIAACCVRTLDDTFCTDLTEEDCDDYATLTGWATSWSIRGKCDEVPCSEYGGTPWSAPRGACCYQDEGQTATCVDNLTFEECMDTYLTPDNLLDTNNWVSFRQGETCSADCEMQTPSGLHGACCLSLDDFCCVEAVTREVCNTLGGGWLGTASTCVSCVPRETPSGVCCLHGLVCTSDLTPIRCSALFGSWHGNFDTCREGLPCVGATLVGTPGACCYEYECVDATTPGLQDITEADCLLGGGRWLGIGLCNGNPNDPNVFPAGACDPVECLNVAGLTTYNVETFDATTCIRFGGGPVILLGDVNGDGRVGGMADLLPLINQWGQPSMDADLDGSGMVDVRDLLILFVHWE